MICPTCNRDPAFLIHKGGPCGRDCRFTDPPGRWEYVCDGPDCAACAAIRVKRLDAIDRLLARSRSASMKAWLEGLRDGIGGAT